MEPESFARVVSALNCWGMASTPSRSIFWGKGGFNIWLLDWVTKFTHSLTVILYCASAPFLASFFWYSFICDYVHAWGNQKATSGVGSFLPPCGHLGLKSFALVEDLGLSHSTHMVAHKHSNSRCRESDAVFWPPRAPSTHVVYMPTYHQNTYIHLKKKNSRLS